MARSAWSVLFAVGCYGPAAHPGSPCDQGACPSGLVCELDICIEPTGDGALPSDGRLIDAKVVLPDGSSGLTPFKTPTAIPGVNTGGIAEDDPTFSANLLAIAFTRSSAAAGSELYTGTRASTAASFTVAIATVLNSTADEQAPELSSDGLTMYFSSARSGSGEIYVSTKTGGAWAAPTLVPELSSASDDNDIGVSPDGLTAIVVHLGPPNKMMKYTRATTAGAFGTGVELTALEFVADVAAPALTNGAQTVYFHANGVRDLYVSRFVGGAYTTPAPVTELNTGTRDASPWINQADDHIAFDHDGDLYEATR